MRIKQIVGRAFFVLGLGVLSNCSCDEDQSFIPASEYAPDAVLDFGIVSVSAERTMSIAVTSVGSAGLVLDSLNFAAGSAEVLMRFRFEGQSCTAGTPCTALAPDLASGLGPGQTSSITITYRPCPDAWENNRVKEGFDFTKCPELPDSIEMTIIENTRAASHRIVLAGQPGQAPKMEIYCSQSADCNNPTGERRLCTGLSFGQVSSGASCDLFVEVRNTQRNGKPTGALDIENIEMRVAEINGGPILDATTVGFSILDESGAPLAIDPDHPLKIELASGQSEGSRKFRVRFRGVTSGIFRGQAADNAGFRIYSNDPDNYPFRTVLMTGSASAPDIQITPEEINFGSVSEGRTKTATVEVMNGGDVPLTVNEVRLERDTTGAEFTVRTAPASLPVVLQPLESASVFVRYAPTNVGTDVDSLIIVSNDPDENPARVPITGGALPRIRCEPSDLLTFAVIDPPPPQNCQSIVCRNAGEGRLFITGLDLVGPNNDRNHSSIDDFSLELCPSGVWPCTLSPEIELCAPATPGCNDFSSAIRVCYKNNDNSTTDLADLSIASSDAQNPKTTVTLKALDNPCLFPTPVIERETAEAVAGEQVCVNANRSAAGGPLSGGASVTGWEWGWSVSRSQPEPTFVPATGPRVCFVPPIAGLYIVSLRVTNSCGSQSQTPAEENVTVRAAR